MTRRKGLPIGKSRRGQLCGEAADYLAEADWLRDRALDAKDPLEAISLLDRARRCDDLAWDLRARIKPH